MDPNYRKKPDVEKEDRRDHVSHSTHRHHSAFHCIRGENNAASWIQYCGIGYWKYNLTFFVLLSLKVGIYQFKSPIFTMGSSAKQRKKTDKSSTEVASGGREEKNFLSEQLSRAMTAVEKNQQTALQLHRQWRTQLLRMSYIVIIVTLHLAQAPSTSCIKEIKVWVETYIEDEQKQFQLLQSNYVWIRHLFALFELKNAICGVAMERSSNEFDASRQSNHFRFVRRQTDLKQFYCWTTGSFLRSLFTLVSITSFAGRRERFYDSTISTKLCYDSHDCYCVLQQQNNGLPSELWRQRYQNRCAKWW